MSSEVETVRECDPIGCPWSGAQGARERDVLPPPQVGDHPERDPEQSEPERRPADDRVDEKGLVEHLPVAALRKQFQQPRAALAAGDELVRDLADYDRAFGLNAVEELT
ncbi:MAG TPA: hypothetical protein VKY71_06615 [Actinotalea caeni]|uniref:hypothetical protein n=1 Tax=Actinotalea caeni TaxID=1348467 RepID=UPI002B4B5B16|nr:hypothetical protein [Actinotalea caeni]HLV55226.1 hypothetical protein [Actinotalea caeni]